MLMILSYDWKYGKREIFSKYTINSGIITNKESGKPMSYRIHRTKKRDGTLREEYTCNVRSNDGKRKRIVVARAMLSTFVGSPPSLEHTTDHINRDPLDNNISNLRWATNSEQRNNQDRPEKHNDAFIIVKDGIERTGMEWAK